jgi:uncharacterized RDD family membrane protein YckC
MSFSFGRLRPLTVLLIALLTLCVGSIANAQVLLESSSSSPQTHAWAIYENSLGETLLVHLPPRDPGTFNGRTIEAASPGEVHAVKMLNDFPDAIGAIDDRVYLVYPSTYSQGRKLRRVFSGKAVPSLASSQWGFLPASRLDAEPTIFVEGELEDLVSTTESLFAVVTNKEKTLLLTMESTQWVEVDLPAHTSEHQPHWKFSSIGSDLIAFDLSFPSSDSMPVFVYSNTEDGDHNWVLQNWEKLVLTQDSYQILGTNQGLLIVDWESDGKATIRTYSQSGLFTIASGLDVPIETKLTWLGSVNRLVGLLSLQGEPMETDESGDQVAAPSGQASFKLFEVDLADGSIVYAGDPVIPVAVSAAEFRFLVGMVVLIMVGVLVVVILPDRADSMQLPDGFALAEPGRRLISSVVDLFLVAYLMGVLFDVRVMEILTLSVIVRTDGAWLSIPMLMVSGVVIMSVMEWLFGASPGKLLNGLRVVRAESGVMRRVPLWAALVRNIVKWILPPVAALALVDPEMLHRGDRATRTLVAVPLESAQRQNEPKDTDEDPSDQSDPESESSNDQK